MKIQMIYIGFIKHIFKVFLLMLFINTSCRELVTTDFPSFKNIPTVNAILVAGEPLMVKVSQTRGVDSLPLSTITNATINLYVDGKFNGRLEYNGGFYISKALIEAEKAYQCLVNIPGEEPLTCSQILPMPNPICAVEHITVAGRDKEGKIYHAVKITFRNDVSERRYYEVEKTSYGAIVPFSDPIFMNEGLPITIFSNEMIDDVTYTMTLNYTAGYKHIKNGQIIIDPFVVKLRSVTYDYYCYQKQYFLYSNGKYGDITSKTTAFPLYSNIENGYGIFAGYSEFVSDTITPEPYEE